MLDIVPPQQGHTVFEAMESRVRLYSRSFPTVFSRARGAELVTEDGRVFLDFLCGAGALNYGHNHDHIKRRLLDYLTDDGVVHGLDLFTTAKRDFLERFREVVMRPRGLDHHVQFTGPTGANAVEAALKLARKATGRPGVVAFGGAFHGMSQGALSVSGALAARRSAGVSPQDVTFVPYEDGPAGPFDSIGYLRRVLDDPGSGVGLPAAVIVEPVQMDGGVYLASGPWLRALRDLTERRGILLILDEIQTACGRTGSFFCFEQAGITPDLVTVSKSLSGYGLPLSILLMRPEIDVWEPGEHTGTFRGNQLALIGATAALDLWESAEFQAGLRALAARLAEFGAETARAEPGVRVRVRGAVLAVDLSEAGGGPRAREVQRHCYDGGLVLERCGREESVIKVMPPLTIDSSRLSAGLAILRQAVDATAKAAS
ncbi:diaminobutyrate--2-oxoglutarate transaminase [Planotetraspora sp. GP83]|uniref:diaminobutyrate--2-oxoglutarate transaminase n=1 Tax=Planotetraspora sp. GP83 TaxID=3156264 RepID=UPI00351641FA